MGLASRLVGQDLKELHKKNIRLLWLGTEEKLDKKLIKSIKEAVELTKNNTKGTLALCFNYGGKEEIIHAVKDMIKFGDVKNITENTIDKYLYSPALPPIDMMIRTSGEQRISNFMLWRIAYSELIFIKKHWPDFGVDDLNEVIKKYSKRQRRYGG
jgi:undecaprenyl diphosphate synthase